MGTFGISLVSGGQHGDYLLAISQREKWFVVQPKLADEINWPRPKRRTPNKWAAYQIRWPRWSRLRTCIGTLSIALPAAALSSLKI